MSVNQRLGVCVIFPSVESETVKVSGEVPPTSMLGVKPMAVYWLMPTTLSEPTCVTAELLLSPVWEMAT